MRQCSAKWTRNVLLGVSLVICRLTTAYAQVDRAPPSQVTKTVHLLLIPPPCVVIGAKLFSRLPSFHDLIFACALLLFFI